MTNRTPFTALGAISVVVGSALVACTSPPLTQDAERTGTVSSALFDNGGFETGTHDQAPPSWIVATNINRGVTLQDPQTRAGLDLRDGGVGKTVTLVASGPESQPDPDLGSGASLRWPKFGDAVAIVNQKGQSRNVNSMKQTMTVGAADIDPRDGLAHIRFALAPVLQDPGHDPHEQPYFFVQLTNVTKGAILYQDFNFANQPGVPWKSVGTGNNTIRYTDWALVDISPGSAKLAPGDQVELEVIAAGCSQSGHWGHVYVDGVGPTVPGLFIMATGPSAANEGSEITYVLTYQNGGEDGADDVVVEFNTPPGTTFSGVNAPTGVNCEPPAGETPPVGQPGRVRCVVGDVPPGDGGSFPITVRIDDGTAPGEVVAGNYSVSGDGISPLLGPKVKTTITDGIVYADLGVTIDGGSASTVPAGDTVTYVIEVTNDGPEGVTGASVTADLPSQLTGVTWTCVGADGAICTGAGTDDLDDTIDIPVGGKVTYTVTGTVSPTAEAGQLENIVSVGLPTGTSDPDPTNNSAGDYKRITAANGTGCAVAVDCTSDVCAETDGKCGHPDGEGPCDATTGSTVCRSGACSTDGTCMPSGGCNVDADCSGNDWCNISVGQCNKPIANGQPMPTDPDHADPTLDGTCSEAAADLTCASGVCDSDDRCGYADGTGPCTSADGGLICRSGSCSATGVCKAEGACIVDADCASSEYCDTGAAECRAKLPNGSPLPKVEGRTDPTIDGKCSAEAAAVVCLSGVCDASDDKCGYPNGAGSCTASDAATVCRSKACDPNDGKCGLADESGPCASDVVCRSGSCNKDTRVCGSGCTTDSDCADAEYCKSDGTCSLKRPDGDECSNANQCMSGACEDEICDSLVPSGSGIACAVRAPSGTTEGAGAAALGMMLAAAGLFRRRRSGQQGSLR